MAVHRHAIWLMSAVMLLGAPVMVLAPLARRASAQPATTVVRAAGAPAAGSIVESWGDDSAGELGDGSLQEEATPVAVAGLSGVQAVSAGDRFSLALLSNGTVEAWGDNGFGELGNGTTTYSALPVKVHGLSGVTAVAAGGGHALALLSDGTVMAWGDNQYGQLGDGTTANSDVPVAVAGLSGVTGIAAGSLHSMALLTNGTVDTWGYNGNGQLGDGNFNNRDVAKTVPGVTGVTQVSAGGLFSLALKRNGTVRAWGENINGELGNGGTKTSDRPVTVSDLKDAQQISAGWYDALALLPGGAVVGWGDNTMDIPEAEPVSGATAVAAGGMFKLALLGNGTVDAWGDNALDQLGAGPSYPGLGTGPVIVTDLTGVTAIAAGANHSLALVPSGSGITPTAPSAQPSIWQDVPSPDPGAPPPPALTDTVFKAVSAATTTDAWAVGQSFVGIREHAVAAHWDGSAWTAATLPKPPGDGSTFSAVVDLGPGDAWAVGWTQGKNNRASTLTEHWDGTAWSIVASPDPFRSEGGIDELQAVAGTAPGDVWAFGDVLASGGVALLYLHLVNGAWKVVNGPGGPAIFTSATAITSNDIWAVGDYIDLAATFSVHWNGRSWTSVLTPQLNTGSNPENLLTGVSAAGPSDVWASGYEEIPDENLATPYLLHDTGSGWKLVTVPTLGGEGSMLLGVSALSAGDAWAVGQTYELDGSILTLTEQYNGTTWSIKPSLDPGELGPLVNSSLVGVTSGGAGDVLAVGAQRELDGSIVTLSLVTSKG